eukprot:CAMPEP_0116573824 /NCGR_PEP_ID=MMETSP0397-20121206/19017_1 /TAXON_ID=216820 /ORGANISM="Cyclophora tenuis, Strain ECT3854" /LENGTH=211 /DNA_ID=CAMNT_0004102449 /DNA_START=82 /DNA_END=714 /DNA_ORIENTATION=-
MLRILSVVASPKLVKAHHQSVHGKFSGSGFKTVTVAIPGCKVQRFRICVGDRPEDVKKWLAERKKRFPRQRPLETPSAEKDTKKGGGNIGSLLAGYGSSSDEEDDDEKQSEGPIVKKKKEEDSQVCQPTTQYSPKPPSVALNTTMRSRPCRYFMRNGRCRNGDSCKFSHDVMPRALGKKGASPSSTSLLRKLLQTDAERERTLTLQLLRYI